MHHGGISCYRVSKLDDMARPSGTVAVRWAHGVNILNLLMRHALCAFLGYASLCRE